MDRLMVKECLSFGWKTFWARPWLFVQAGLLLFLLNLAINLIQTALDMGGEYAGYAAGMAISFAAAVLTSALSFVISMGETSFFLRAHDDTAATTVRDLWHPHPFWKFVGASFLVGILVLLGLVALIIPGIIIAIALGFATYLVIEKNLGPIEAVKASAALTRGKRWTLFVLFLAILGINVLGLLALVAGLFVTIPVSFLATVHAYRMLSDDEKSGEDALPLEVIPVA